MYVDGALNCRGAGVRIILISLKGIRVDSHSGLVSMYPTMRLSMKLSLWDLECQNKLEKIGYNYIVIRG